MWETDMQNTTIPTFASLIATSALAAGALAQSPPQVMDEIEKLKQQMSAMEKRHDAEIASLKNENGDKWLTQQRAEEIRGVVVDVLADAESRSSLQADGATAGWNKGFFLSSADGNFKLKLAGLLQTRFVYNQQPTTSRAGASAVEAESSEYGTEVRRAELVFSGNIIDPSWTYGLKLAFNQNGLTLQTDAGTQATTNAPTLDDAFIRKDFGNGFSLKGGQYKANYNLEEWSSSQAMQLVERSVVNSYFRTDYIQGIELQYESSDWRVLVNYNDGGGNRNIGAIGQNTSATSSPTSSGNTTEWATSGRVDWKIAGNWSQFKEMMAFRGTDNALQIGAAYNWQRGGAQNLQNDAFIGNSDGMNVSYTTDIAWRNNGASLFAAALGNTFYARPGGAAAVNSYGALIQGGYFVSDALELVARWEYLNVSGGAINVGTVGTAGNASSINAQHFQIYTVGSNYYLVKNQLKISADIGYVVGALLFQNGIYNGSITGADYRSDENTGATGQAVARVQMQLAF